MAKMKREWLLDDIAGTKKFIDENGGDVELFMRAKSLLPLLKEDNDIILDIQKGKEKAVDYLYIRHGSKIDGKYKLEITFFM